MILATLLVFPMGCFASDPLPEGLYTKNVFPGTASTYDLGSDDLPYDEGNFDNLIVNDQITTARITYSEVYFQDLRIPATAVRLSGVKPPLLTQYKGGLVLEFEDKAAPNEQLVYFDLQIPDGWKEGTEIHVHIHWVPETNATGAVGWRLTTSWANVGDDFPAESTADRTVTINNQADNHIRSALVTLVDTSKLSSSMVLGSLMRLSDTDTYADSAYLVEIDFHMEIDKPGDDEHTIFE